VSAVSENAPAAEVRVETPFQRFRSEFCESKIAVGALVMLVAIIVLALLAPWITPQDPYDLAQVDVLDGALPPGEKAFAGYTMWLGSDGLGRDLYSAILYGIRISLSVGVAAGLIALAIGTAIGLIAAYAGPWTCSSRSQPR
jgi:peptide/nickel transport system permease protein